MAARQCRHLASGAGCSGKIHAGIRTGGFRCWQDLHPFQPFRELCQIRGGMGNVRSQLGQKFCSQFLPEEQAEIDRLFDALSSEKHSSDTSPRSFSLKALKSHIGEALPLEMVTRLYDGMRRVDLMGKAKGPSESISREQFTMSMSHLLKGNSEEKSLMILKMISATEGPVKAREIQKFTEDLVGSVVHVLNYRQELRGWTQKTGLGPPPRVQVLAAQLFSEMDLRGGEKLPGPQQLDCECDLAMVEAWVFRVPHVATFLSVVIHRGFLLRLPLDLATLVPERHIDQERVFESVLDILSVIYINSHLPREQRHRWRLLFSSKLHGHSFTQLCGHITQQGPCVVLVEDHDGHVFGGFASCSWEVKPQFQGSRPSRTDWAWEASIITLGCGSMWISGKDTARPSPSVPRTVALSCQPRRTSGLRRWRCGEWGTPRCCSRPRAAGVSWTRILRPRSCWRPVGGVATAKGSGTSRMVNEEVPLSLGLPRAGPWPPGWSAARGPLPISRVQHRTILVTSRWFWMCCIGTQ
ncbi:MTOR-associated protein MEAK7 isoform X2 [Canis lupus familiaris]|uniref:MTOR-associated protein MEAK7 isoform X2 n=1 Tax=Canis lupus familiaris TaxID=9615 RepID=UPI0018F3C304|nr:MTOR-associated protein MEAK7 isoform X2 [Canis lupus familiaris]